MCVNQTLGSSEQILLCMFPTRRLAAQKAWRKIIHIHPLPSYPIICYIPLSERQATSSLSAAPRRPSHTNVLIHTYDTRHEQIEGGDEHEGAEGVFVLRDAQVSHLFCNDRPASREGDGERKGDGERGNRGSELGDILADDLSCATLTHQVLSRRDCFGRVLQLTSQDIAAIGDR